MLVCRPPIKMKKGKLENIIEVYNDSKPLTRYRVHRHYKEHYCKTFHSSLHLETHSFIYGEESANL